MQCYVLCAMCYVVLMIWHIGFCYECFQLLCKYSAVSSGAVWCGAVWSCWFGMLDFAPRVFSFQLGFLVKDAFQVSDKKSPENANILKDASIGEDDDDDDDDVDDNTAKDDDDDNDDDESRKRRQQRCIGRLPKATAQTAEK